MNDETLRQAYAELMKSTTRAGRENCPPAETLAATVDRKGNEESRLAILDHVMSCLHCRKDFEILRAVEAAAPAPAQRTVPLAMAASIFLLVAATLLWSNLRRGEEPTRSGPSSLALISPQGEVGPVESLRLVWQPASPANGEYTAEILRDDATVVWAQKTRDTTVTVAAAALESGVDYRWWVRAELADGTEARSELRHFRLKRP